MTRQAVYGFAQGMDGREAAIKATQAALDQLGAQKPVLGIVFASEEFESADVAAGLSGLLGDTPLWGISTTRPLAGDQERPRSVVIGLLAGSDLKASVLWLPGYAEDSADAARQVVRALRGELILPQGLLLAADGVAGSPQPLCAGLADLPVRAGGCLAAGGYGSGKTAVFGKNQSGAGALSAALLSGRLRLSGAAGHGWRDTGLHYIVSQARDVWVQELDGQPVAETLAYIFGRSAREWAAPPLNELARLYPLGVEPLRRDEEMLLRSPLRVEVDGSLRLTSPVAEGARVHLMLGDPDYCLEAVRAVARQALLELGEARPLLALAAVDVAWQHLFESRPNQVAHTLQEALGAVPLIGGYTLGQLTRASLHSPPLVKNQTLSLQLIGVTEG